MILVSVATRAPGWWKGSASCVSADRLLLVLQLLIFGMEFIDNADGLKVAGWTRRRK